MATSRLLLSALTGIGFASLIALPAGAVPISQPQAAFQAPNPELVQQVQWRGRGYGYGYPGYYGYRRNNGAAVAAGVIGGLALGAVIAGAAAAPPPPAYYAPPPPPGGDWYAYCASKYRSFDPASGTYLGYDGLRHPCQ
jgi:hypothetical protein